jgi:hypothetical protein
MNTSFQLDNSSKIKETLCQHFKLPLHKSSLRIQQQRYLGSGNDGFHYYIFALMDDTVTRRAFGKISPKNELENNALQYLMSSGADAQSDIGRPIALLKEGNRSLLLLEYLEGCSPALTLAHFLRIFPNTASNIIKLGKAILDKIYTLQTRCPTRYRSLSLEDAKNVPGQPEPIGVFEQVESLISLSNATKTALKSRINAILTRQTIVRKGLVHGQMGMRNIMIDDRSNVFFIDWEYLQSQGLCAYDPCYMIIMLLMRSVQLFVSQSALESIGNSLFLHTRCLEEFYVDSKYTRFVEDSLWFAKCLAMIDTLWTYETINGTWLKTSLSRKYPKIKYLTHLIENECIE